MPARRARRGAVAGARRGAVGTCVARPVQEPSIDGATRVVGVIGDPIAHTRSPAMHNAAFRALGYADAAFGPAEDGGYWLVCLGSSRPAHPFARVRWSTSHALSDTLRNFTGREVALLRTLSDVDTVAEWRARYQAAEE